MKFFLRVLFLGAITLCSTSLWAQSAPSPATADVLKMAQANVGDDVLLAYVQNDRRNFRLTVDDILALKGAKVGSEVIKAMLAHDSVVVTTTPAPAPDPNPTPVIVPVYTYPYTVYHRPYFGYYHRRAWGYGFGYGW